MLGSVEELSPAWQEIHAVINKGKKMENTMNESGPASKGTEIKRNPQFSVHMLNDYGKVHAKTIQELFDFTLNRLTEICSSGRELAIVATKLEEACFFAKKAMAIRPENNVPTGPAA